MSGSAELHRTIDAGVRFIRRVIDNKVADPIKFQVFLTAHMWREVGKIRAEVLKMFPELEDAQNPLDARCVRCPARVGKAALKKIKADILFDNQFDSVSAWGAGGILFHPGPVEANTLSWCRFRQVKVFWTDWEDYSMAQLAIEELKTIQSAPIEAALRRDRTLISRMMTHNMTLLLNVISTGPIPKADGPEGVIRLIMSRITANAAQNCRVSNQEKEWRDLLDKWIKLRGDVHPCLANINMQPTEAVIIEAITLIVTNQAPGCDFSEDIPECEFQRVTNRFCGGCKYCTSSLGTKDQLQDLKTQTLQVRSPYRASERSALVLVKKMELTLSPTLDVDVNEGAPLWEFD